MWQRLFLPEEKTAAGNPVFKWDGLNCQASVFVYHFVYAWVYVMYYDFIFKSLAEEVNLLLEDIP